MLMRFLLLGFFLPLTSMSTDFYSTRYANKYPIVDGELTLSAKLDKHDVDTLVSFIYRNQQDLRIIYLDDNGLVMTDVVSLCKAFASNPKLQKIFLHNNKIWGSTAVFEKFLAENKNIEVFDLHDNHLSAANVDKIDSLAKSNAHHNARKTAWFENIPEMIAQGNISFPLSVTIHAHDIEEVTDAIEDFSAIKKISFKSNRINLEAMTVAIKLISRCDCLSELNLSGSPLSVDMTQTLADLLSTNKTIEKLVLIDCEMGVEQGLVVANMLKKNRTLSHVDLGANHLIKRTGIKEQDFESVLIEAMKTNKVLKRISAGRLNTRLVIELINRKSQSLYVDIFLPHLCLLKDALGEHLPAELVREIIFMCFMNDGKIHEDDGRRKIFEKEFYTSRREIKRLIDNAADYNCYQVSK